VWAYQVNRISSNYILVDEVTNLQGSTVLFYLNGDNVIDESDSFYGEGNNGRDCIHYETEYQYDLTDCYFQNDQTSYFASQYLAGSVITTGISRFNNKFIFSLSNQLGTYHLGNGVVAPEYQFSLVPNPDADFSFSVSPDGVICPQLLDTSSTISGCQYQLSYIGTEAIVFNGNPVSFNSGVSPVLNVPYDSGSQTIGVTANGKVCFLLQCDYGGTAQTSTVEVVPPTFQVVAASDLALKSSVGGVVDATLNYSLTTMYGVEENLALANKNLSKIITALKSLDFNVTKLVPYQDFSELRAQIDQLIGNLQPAGTMQCSEGVFTSIECFGSNILNAIIVVVVVVVILIILYVVCFKFGLAKTLCC